MHNLPVCASLSMTMTLVIATVLKTLMRLILQTEAHHACPIYSKVNLIKSRELMNGGSCYFTQSRIFVTVKLPVIKFQCNKYNEVSAFSHMLQMK